MGALPWLRRQAVHPPAPGRANPRCPQPERPSRRPGSTGARRRSRLAGRRPARRPNDRPPCRPPGRAHLAPGWRLNLRSPPKETIMPATIIDSAIFQGIFSSDEMRHVWSDENRTQKYLDIEAALAKVQGRLGLIPKEAGDE